MEKKEYYILINSYDSFSILPIKLTDSEFNIINKISSISKKLAIGNDKPFIAIKTEDKLFKMERWELEETLKRLNDEGH